MKAAKRPSDLRLDGAGAISCLEYITEQSVNLLCIPGEFRHPLSKQFEEFDEDGDLVRSYDEWGLASVLTYAYYKRVQAKTQYSKIEMLIGECLEMSRHPPLENKTLFQTLKREIKAGNEEQAVGWSKILISKIASALAEQHEDMEDDEDD